MCFLRRLFQIHFLDFRLIFSFVLIQSVIAFKIVIINFQLSLNKLYSVVVVINLVGNIMYLVLSRLFGLFLFMICGLLSFSFVIIYEIISRL